MHLPDRVRHISESGLLALYLLDFAAKNQVNTVVLSNSLLRKWFNVSRVYTEKAEKLGSQLKPVFPEYKVSTDDKERTTLCLHVIKDISFKERKSKKIDTYPSFEDIENSLGFQVYALKAERV